MTDGEFEITTDLGIPKRVADSLTPDDIARGIDGVLPAELVNLIKPDSALQADADVAARLGRLGAAIRGENPPE